MKARQFKCVNFGSCAKADAREAVALDAGEETSCPECGKMLTPVGGTGKAGPAARSGKRVVFMLAGLLALALGVVLTLPAPDPEPEPIPAPSPAPVIPLEPEPTPEPVPAPQPKPRPEPAPAPHPVVDPEPTPVPTPDPAPLPPPVPPPPEPPSEDPSPSPPPYSGPASGTIVWEGEVSGTELVTIQNGSATPGRLVSGSLPGVAIILQPTDEKRVAIAAAPQPADQFQRVVFRVKNKGRTRVILRWALP